jgi:hypothetical protein
VHVGENIDENGKMEIARCYNYVSS